ncbi:mutator family transposase [Paraburkholderia sp. BL10I2N1]|nr:mutator family transposase [Paraburkholderia sp. BL10I2N1]
MSRLLVAVLGFVWGLALTWVSLYVVNHVHWLVVQGHSSGCSDMEHCSPRIQTLLVLFGTLLWPSVGLATVNIVAFKRWSTRKWAFAFCFGSLFVVLFYLSGFIAPVFAAFKKAPIELALGAELGHHLGYPPGAERTRDATNQRNGKSGKTVLTDDAPLRLDIPSRP